jgi:transposase
MTSIAQKIGCAAETLRSWVWQADRDAGRSPDRLRTDEQQELRRLRGENRVREERESPRKAAAWFARETTSIPSKDSSS